MSDKGQDLFEIMDSALKRQREGLGARSHGQPPAAAAPPPREAPAQEAPPLLREAAPEPQARAAAVQPPAAAPSVGAHPASGRISGPLAPEDAAPQQDVQPYTQRLQRMIESPRAAPAAGSLRPNEVLRGTVFGSRRMEAEAAQEQAASSSVRASQSERTHGSVVVRPLAPVPSQRQQAVGSVRAAAVSQAMHAPPPPPVAPPSMRGMSGPLQPAVVPPARGLHISAEMAVLAVIVIGISWVMAFFLGMRQGASSLHSDRQPGDGVRVETPGENADGGQERLPPRIDEVPPSDLRHVNLGNSPDGGQQQQQQPVGPRTSGENRWTIELVRFGKSEKAFADERAKKLNGQGLGEVWVCERKIGSRIEYAVCVGRYPASEDAEKSLRDLAAIGRIKVSRTVNVFQYRE